MIDAEVNAALDNYVQLGSANQSSKPRRGTKQGTKIVGSRRGVFTWLDQSRRCWRIACQSMNTLNNKIDHSIKSQPSQQRRNLD